MYLDFIISYTPAYISYTGVCEMTFSIKYKTNMETEQEQIIRQIYDYTVKRLMQDKVPTETVRQELIENGVGEEDALTNTQ